MNDFWSILRIVENCACPLALMFIMCRFKCARRQALYALLGVVGLSAAINAGIFLIFGREVMMRFCLLITAVPTLLVLLSLSRDPFSMLFFNFFSAVNALYFVSIIGLSSSFDRIWLDILIRLLLYAFILYLLRRFFREPYQFLSVHMKSGWGVISAIPFLFFALVMFMGLYPTIRTDNFLAVIFLYGILCAVYVVIYQVFRRTHAQLTQEENSRLLASQVAVQERQLKMQEEHLEHLQVLRHDFRHYLRGLSALLESGDLEGAKDSVAKITQRYLEQGPAQYCDHPILNAVLAYYVEQGQQLEITVDVRRFCLPNPLPMDPLELSTVFGNALENACNACAKLPDGAEKSISVTCLDSPQFVFEIANTYDGTPVPVDGEGFPVTGEAEHGIGTRSIAAFVHKYHAIHDYELAGNVFRLRILIPPQPKTAFAGT